jgi:hypothetical protein
MFFVDLWTLEIIQDTDPDLPTDFAISVTGNGVSESATLDDDTDPTLANTFDVVDLPQEVITITHTGASNSITTVDCGSVTPTSETTSGDDTIVVLPAQPGGEHVQCTFTSTCKTLTFSFVCDSFAKNNHFRFSIDPGGACCESSSCTIKTELLCAGAWSENPADCAMCGA